MEIVTVRLSSMEVLLLDQLVFLGLAPSRSQAIRNAIALIAGTFKVKPHMLEAIRREWQEAGRTRRARRAGRMDHA
jgi:Arc/MetJ-type ribon-helix-helix transcriptional regulator